MKTPSQICATSVWIWKGGIKKNSGNIFSKISPNLFRKALSIDKDWPVTYLWCLPMRLSNNLFSWWVNYTMRANGAKIQLFWPDWNLRRYLGPPSSGYSKLMGIFKSRQPSCLKKYGYTHTKMVAIKSNENFYVYLKDYFSHFALVKEAGKQKQKQNFNSAWSGLKYP